MKVLFDEAIVQKWFRGANPFRNKAMVRLLPPLPTKRERPPIVVPVDHAQALILGRRGRRVEAQLELEIDPDREDAEAERVPFSRRVRYALAFTSGDRDGELSGLTWEMLVLEGTKVPVMEIDRARRLAREEDEELGPLKRATSARTMPLHPAAVAALRWWRDDADGVAWHLGRAPLPSDPVFPSERHGADAEFARPKSATKIREDLEALRLPTVGAKGRNVTMHATRRSFLTFLEKAGVPERDRKVLAGHGIADVTHRHYTAEDEARLVALESEVAKIPLRWEPPNPRPNGAGFVPGFVPGIVTAGTKGRRSRSSMSRTAMGLSGVPSPIRTGDLRFRNSSQTCDPDVARAPTSEHDSHSQRPTIGEDAADGLGHNARVTKRHNAKSGPGLAVVPRGAVAVRAEVDGAVVARTELVEGEPLHDAEERLRLGLRQKGRRAR